VINQQKSADRTQSPRKPAWLKRSIPRAGRKSGVVQLLRDGRLHTVCEEAGCPNRGECFARGTATFLIMGDRCTRDCRFCTVTHGAPESPDPREPARIAHTVRQLQLKHAVITSVTRDDMPDGGAGHFAAVIHALRETAPNVTTEVLVPDFRGDTDAVDRVLASNPDVFNHNIETVPRLYGRVRPQADYHTSLRVLAYAADKGRRVKSGLMVGLGETRAEVESTLRDLHEAGCAIVTIGQYLRPSARQVAVAAYIDPQTFEHYKRCGADLGIKQVVAGPFVRSSYRADEVLSGEG
jgi:lipoic acid synthetase